MYKYRYTIVKVSILATSLLTLLSLPSVAQINFTYHSQYSYLKGKDAVLLGGNWKDNGFDYSSWQTGNAPFRYGDGAGGVELTDMMNNYTTIYLRSSFTCSNKGLISEVSLEVDYDDGFILWINGVEALRRNAPQYPAYNSVAPANHEAGAGEIFIINAAPLNLVDGINSIAVQGFNVSLNSSDFYFDLSLSAEKNLPEVIDTTGIDFSVESGFFENPFNVLLISHDPSTRIIYTLDGSNPQNSSTSFTSDSPANVLIDPSSTTGRALTPAVTLRASLTKEGYKPSKPASRTFIFPEKVKVQSWPGGGWPTENINGQLIDLEMDPQIVNDPDYAGQIRASLLDIPSISVVTDLKNLFDPASGIYVNATGHGFSWEKECSAELIHPDGTRGFSVNAGLRIRGGWSRHDEFPKHAFRLFFREEYGDNKLYYPLFGEEGVNQFDKIDLRTEQNYAWSNGFASNSFVREVFSRDSQRDMGQPYTRSRYYHLYLNGMYWGLYQTQERSDARYAESYFGGNREDYDVVKVNMENFAYSIEATDGSLDSWSRLWAFCSDGFSTDISYYQLEGRDKNGKPVKGGEIYIDIDNLIDYMMVIFYTGNFDAPTTSFGQNKGTNNFYAIEDRTDKSKGFTFYVHDAEHSLFDQPHPPGIGLYEDRVNIAARTDNMKMEVSSFSKFHPQWLHYKMTANKEYRERFASRAYRHLEKGGVFSPDSALARINKRIDEVNLAIIAESARWGDAKTVGSFPYNKNEHWLPEINKIRNNFIPLRTNIVKGQLKEARLYPTTYAPVFIGPDGEILQQDLPLTSPITLDIKNPNTSGTIYYTLNGKDPRKTGGGISAEALFSTRDIKLPVNASSQITARIYSDGLWSALKQVNFIKHQEDYSNIKVTELHYHPPDFVEGANIIDGKDLEFIEFKNTSRNAINLTGLALDSAVRYSFPLNKLLPPGQFYVIVSKPSKFYDFYGMVASGNYQGNFSNAGEEVLLKDASGNKIINFTYDDSSPWPDLADGGGYSLSSSEINPSGNPAAPSYWTISVIKGGTPFADNIVADPYQHGSYPEGTLTAYPNPTTGLITVRMITDEDIDIIELIISDITGKRVKSVTIGNPGMIDLAGLGLPAGIYFLRANSPESSKGLRIIFLRQ